MILSVLITLDCTAVKHIIPSEGNPPLICWPITSFTAEWDPESSQTRPLRGTSPHPTPGNRRHTHAVLDTHVAWALSSASPCFRALALIPTTELGPHTGSDINWAGFALITLGLTILKRVIRWGEAPSYLLPITSSLTNVGSWVSTLSVGSYSPMSSWVCCY